MASKQKGDQRPKAIKIMDNYLHGGKMGATIVGCVHTTPNRKERNKCIGFGAI
jgi:hypothetical protein